MQNSESIGQNFFVRICGDSPLIDHKLVDTMIWKSKFELFDIFTNAFPKTYPAGMSVEIVKTSLIRRFIKRFNISDREHVTKYFYNNYKKFKIINFFCKKDLSKINLCIDTQKDFNYIKNLLKGKKIIDYYYIKN
jgi:spore coat polysaccharide biosynthesis protein SpsF